MSPISIDDTRVQHAEIDFFSGIRGAVKPDTHSIINGVGKSGDCRYHGMFTNAAGAIWAVILRDFNIKDLRKDYQIIFNKAESPIIIKTEDKEKALDELKTIIHTHKGSVLQPLFIKEGISVTLSMEEKEEEAFFEDLSRLGDVQMGKEGYRDKEGKIVVLIIER